MASEYYLPCDCGKRVIVSVGDAGETVRCLCGKELDVPRLRDLRELEPRETVSPDREWNKPQAVVFTVGGLISAISIGLACVFFFNWYTLDTEKPDIKGSFQVSADDWDVDMTWQAWNELSNLEEYPLAWGDRTFLDKETARLVEYHAWATWRSQDQLKKLKWACAVAVFGLLVIGAAFFIRQPPAK